MRKDKDMWEGSSHIYTLDFNRNCRENVTGKTHSSLESQLETIVPVKNRWGESVPSRRYFVGTCSAGTESLVFYISVYSWENWVCHLGKQRSAHAHQVFLGDLLVLPELLISAQPLWFPLITLLLLSLEAEVSNAIGSDFRHSVLTGIVCSVCVKSRKKRQLISTAVCFRCVSTDGFFPIYHNLLKIDSSRFARHTYT